MTGLYCGRKVTGLILSEVDGLTYYKIVPINLSIFNYNTQKRKGRGERKWEGKRVRRK